LAGLLLVCGLAAAGQAQSTFQLCTQANNNIVDSMVLYLSQVAPGVYHFDGHLRTPSYQIPFIGTTSPSFPDTGTNEHVWVGGHRTAAFGGNQNCTMTMKQDTSGTLSGPIKIVCTGAATPFVVTGTVTQVSCSALASQVQALSSSMTAEEADRRSLGYAPNEWAGKE
jgi:hypothetical protein